MPFIFAPKSMGLTNRAQDIWKTNRRNPTSAFFDNPSPRRLRGTWRGEKSASCKTFFLGVHKAAPLELVIQGVQQETPAQRRLCKLGPLGKCCIKWKFLFSRTSGYVHGKKKYMQFSELDSRSLYSQHISNPLGFTEPPLGSTTLDVVEARLEPRSG